MTNDPKRARVLEDFDQARKDAAMQDILSGLRKKRAQLLSFDAIQDQFQVDVEPIDSVRVIPLDAVRGSVGRYNDFNADFLPTNAHDRERWASVKLAMESGIDLPPIQVYQIGRIYFVIDGNHRVSVAKTRGDTDIRATVLEIPTRVELTPEDTETDVVRKAALNHFFQSTQLDERPGVKTLQATEPGSYAVLLQQIEMVRFQVEAETGSSYPLPDAANRWYEDYYLPVIEILRTRNLLKHYPGRTETDLYVWLLENHQALAQEFGWGVHLENVAANIEDSEQAEGPLRRILRTATDPEAGTGKWRESRLAMPRGRMFSDIVVLLDPDEPMGPAYRSALRVAAEESAHLLGLWVAADDEAAARFDALKAQYEDGCKAVDVFGQLAMGRGDRSDLVQARARWADLLVIQSSGGRAPSRALVNVLAGVHIPVWVARPTEQPLDRILLAYDGRPKAEEALFLSAYLAALWGLAISVLTVTDDVAPIGVQDRARRYLETYHIEANYLTAGPPAAEAILGAVAVEGAGLLVTGSIHMNRIGRVSLGKTLEKLLVASPVPLLICR